MKLARLWQPRQPLFWLMIGFNALSSAGAWALRALILNELGLAVVGGLSLLNAGMGLLAAWRLVREPLARDARAASEPAR